MTTASLSSHGQRHWRRFIGAVLFLCLPLALPAFWLGFDVASYGWAQAWRTVPYALAVALGLGLVCRALGRHAVWPTLVLYAAALTLTIGEAVSWLMQGSSFNERFFVHLSLENLGDGLRAYPLAATIVGLALIVCGIGAWLMLRTTTRPRGPWWLVLPALPVLGAALVLDGPPRHLHQYLTASAADANLAESAAGARVRALINLKPTPRAQLAAHAGRNLVFVYLESLERSYTDAKRFPGLTPNIDRLRHAGLDFSGIRTFPGATYTIAGEFASQCGAPYLLNGALGIGIGRFGLVPGNDNTAAATFHAKLACLGDVLHAAGYHQTYLSGVDLSFANTGTFFRMHGYDTVLGRAEIERLHHGRLPQVGWGVEDDAIFAEALGAYRAGTASGKPFSVVMSTIDTHPPSGHMLAGCTKYAPIRNAMLDAVHCSDALLGRFIDRLQHEPGWANTVVVVMSDHVAMRNDASPLYPPDDQRQPLLFIVNAGQGDRPARMFHMDIAPTVLAALGVDSNATFIAGADRSHIDAPDSTLPTDDVAVAVLREALWAHESPPKLCSKQSLANWYGAGLDIGGWQLPLMDGGFPATQLRDDLTLLAVINEHAAKLSLLPAGSEGDSVATALRSGASVLQMTPFWDGHGRALALDLQVPGGAWASLGAEPSLRDVHLRAASCAALLAELQHAAPGTRVDFSHAFGTRALSTADAPQPGIVRPARVPATTTPTVNARIVLARITARQTGSEPFQMSYNDRLTMYPGNAQPTWADIDVTGIGSISLEPGINPVWGACADAKPQADFTATLDGRVVVPPTRVTNADGKVWNLSTAGARVLHVEFTPAGANSACDWAYLRVPRLVPAPRVQPQSSKRAQID